MEPNPTIFLIDGSAYVYRAYHAIRGLSNSKGQPTNAVFGFARMLIKLIEDQAPRYAAILFDAKGPTFRHERYQDYKANRPPVPEDLKPQIPIIKQLAGHFNLPVIEVSGFEADDLIGTLSGQAVKAGFKVVMVTGDKDFVQLISDRATIWDPMKDKTIDLDVVKAQYGLEPDQMVEVMGLSGDSIDNIPGVPGVGQKTALKLIQTYGSMENLYEQVDSIKANKQRTNLIQYKEQAFLSRDLSIIRLDAPVSFEPDRFRYQGPDREKLFAIFKELEFRQLQQDFASPGQAREKDYRAIMDERSLKQLLKRLAKATRFALDTETTSENPMQAQLVGLSFSLEPDQAYYIPCAHRYLNAPVQLPLKKVLEDLKPVLENPGIGKIGQNIKYDWIVLSRHGVELQGVAFDTMLASYLLNPSKRAHNLDQIALDFLDHKTITFQEVVGRAKPIDGFAGVPVEKAVPYACEDADITLMAMDALAPRLESIGLTELFQKVEMPLVGVLLRMEKTGIRVDPDRLANLSKSFAGRLAKLEGQIYELAGERFNINSSQQLGRILFEKLKLPVQKRTRKSTAYSTDVNVLTTLAQHHQLPALMLEHRTLAKLKSTYSDALSGLIHPDTGRIHTSFNQTVTATGRLSSSDPNLQNIPIRTEEGRDIRRAFVPRKGWHLLSADYSQVELRILAHYSDDPILIRSFVEDEDIHARTASEVFQVDPVAVTPELRRQAKAINFGIIYGMSPFGLSKQLEISQAMAKVYIDSYFSRYEGVRRFLDRTIEEARQSQQAGTLLGRIRLLPDINSKNHNVRQFAERTAINTPIQGTAADLIKIAMIDIDARLQKGGFQTAMLLSVHDELLFEAPPEEIDAVRKLVKGLMEGVWELKVPLKVNLAVGENWAEAH